MKPRDEAQAVQTEDVSADEMWSFALKKQNGFLRGRDSSAKKPQQCSVQEVEVGDCWIGLSLASSSGLILAARVGKHTDAFPIAVSDKHQKQNGVQAFQHGQLGQVGASFYPLRFQHLSAKTERSN